MDQPVTKVKIPKTLFLNVDREHWGELEEVELISLLCVPVIEMVRDDLEYSIEQYTSYVIVFRHENKIYNCTIDLDNIQ